MPIYKCNKCNKFFKQKSNFTRHINLITKCNEKKFTLAIYATKLSHHPAIYNGTYIIIVMLNNIITHYKSFLINSKNYNNKIYY